MSPCLVTESFLDRCYVGIGEYLRAVGIYSALFREYGVRACDFV